MSVDAQGMPAKSLPFFRQRFEADAIFGMVHDAAAVAVDEGDEVVQTGVRRIHRGFPGGTFVAFAVTEDHETAEGTIVALRDERMGCRQTQAVAERTGDGFDAGDGR